MGEAQGCAAALEEFQESEWLGRKLGVLAAGVVFAIQGFLFAVVVAAVTAEEQTVAYLRIATAAALLASGVVLQRCLHQAQQLVAASIVHLACSAATGVKTTVVNSAAENSFAAPAREAAAGALAAALAMQCAAIPVPESVQSLQTESSHWHAAHLQTANLPNVAADRIAQRLSLTPLHPS